MDAWDSAVAEAAAESKRAWLTRTEDRISELKRQNEEMEDQIKQNNKSMSIMEDTIVNHRMNEMMEDKIAESEKKMELAFQLAQNKCNAQAVKMEELVETIKQLKATIDTMATISSASVANPPALAAAATASSHGPPGRPPPAVMISSNVPPMPTRPPPGMIQDGTAMQSSSVAAIQSAAGPPGMPAMTSQTASSSTPTWPPAPMQQHRPGSASSAGSWAIVPAAAVPAFHHPVAKFKEHCDGDAKNAILDGKGRLMKFPPKYQTILDPFYLPVGTADAQGDPPHSAKHLSPYVADGGMVLPAMKNTPSAGGPILFADKDGALAEIFTNIRISEHDTTVTEKEMIVELQHYGPLRAVNFPRDEYGTKKDSAYVEYQQASAANAAVYEMHGKKIGNKIMQVKLAYRPIYQTSDVNCKYPARFGLDILEYCPEG